MKSQLRNRVEKLSGLMEDQNKGITIKRVLLVKGKDGEIKKELLNERTAIVTRKTR